jgi:2-methylcitrate dehydratase PrpD
MVVGYEVTCRLGRELGTDAYHRGFHNTGTAGIFGAVAAIAVLKRLSPDTIEAAFGLAGSKAAGSMQYLDNGSWNKRLHPGFAVHDAFLCVALAESGVVGASRIIEGEHGFLHAYSPASKDYLRLTAGLGSEWQFLQCSVKPFPSCRMTHTFIEMADNARQARAVRSADVSAIKLRLPPTNMLLIGDPTPNKIHPQNHIDAQFSVYFQVGNALLYGANTGITAYQRLQDPEIYSLSNITTVTGDPALQVFAGAMRIEWADGQVDEAEMHHPLGEVQHPYTRERVEEKYLSLVEPVFHGDRARDIIALVDDIEAHHLSDLVALLR